MNRKQFNPGTDDRAEFPKLKAEYGEDPARFLQSSKDLGYARISGIRDPELLEAYRAVAKQILSGDDKADVLEKLDSRERELTGDEPDPTPDIDPEPVAATDGGQTVEPTDASESVDSEPDEDEDDTDEPAAVDEGTADMTDDTDLHPKARGVDAGEVLVVEFPGATEYIFPAVAAAAEPYLLRGFDDAGEYSDELSLGEAAGKLDGSLEPTPVDEIDVEPPANAATGGDA